jgi:hypothetical protein
MLDLSELLRFARYPFPIPASEAEHASRAAFPRSDFSDSRPRPETIFAVGDVFGAYAVDVPFEIGQADDMRDPETAVVSHGVSMDASLRSTRR